MPIWELKNIQRFIFFPLLLFFIEVANSYRGTGSCVISFPAVPCTLRKERDSIKFLPQVGSTAELQKLGWDQGEKKTRNTNIRDSKVPGRVCGWTEMKRSTAKEGKDVSQRGSKPHSSFMQQWHGRSTPTSDADLLSQFSPTWIKANYTSLLTALCTWLRI